MPTTASVNFNNNADIKDKSFTFGETQAKETTTILASATDVVLFDDTTTTPVYFFDELDIGAETITIDGDVTIFMTGGFTTGGSTFELADTDSSLTIFMTGKVDMTGSDIFSEGVVNADGEAPLTLYSTNDSVGNNSNAAVYLQGNGKVYMNLYAPFGEVNYKGSNGIFGAVRAKRFNITGTGGLHYDQGLTYIVYSSVYYYYPPGE
jgi:hypothetical protein